MKALKKVVIDDIFSQINDSPFLIVIDYSGMKVAQFQELRKRLVATGAKLQVAKNTFVKQAASSAEYPAELAANLTGQTAIVTGASDVCASAKVLKTYGKEINKVGIRCGVLDGAFLNGPSVIAIADLPPMDILRSLLLGVLSAPAQKLVTVLNEPAASLARVLKAKADQG
ncbi:MAG: 50S ribosomal protein L10 [Verrucomicrobiales bacterium]|jgi:large subunit ribosomal protein L10|nr:50S ribosomal protein L10 [Verrucomicrobiales bacterium]HQW27651.1 50S ribosomal protein L10 [Verrucomicrobiales bacterium]